ncbi:transcriptional regulator NrdR [Candidatus Woesebacteria bacterium RIFCSPHIGHO2_01_FULL_39_32]|uniref:Transcriptional repressor NrdR n=2 Tax=Candidatus Woeseibacteriota TaxID=1752722 RepID=A0A0G0SXP4_9BACT|nr:MAG: Transcriptional repressor NrdR [Candidatus Woesebacteria bacterium GW2011_GWA1_39_8]OGM03665.1 MAG: transcriptional regulator NrdR [Candidatus Woesebacteria bacterium GWB1_37_5]OGM24489.1 MAG: transcriptional regulator NrdR [Candidatus Woesebacteria bacterium RIFCSPHIGHO2_01_FULL_39_32]OGM38880.1 MAG: transcriptional regulator NrdR [Candidatus Woesebacteria bacterium RIFCSPHIGHO2_12_FULL_38_11]OGM63795.1 MAG: transcriptional regulator NrdR [Candidatus Woesebacteria bacterium RIFCSPLOWO2
MRCPFCGNLDTQVLESRTVENGEQIRRRRKCNKCGKRFTTFEKVRGNALWVIKKDGRREAFDREKVKRGILRAVEKRPISMDLVDDIVEGVEREMLREQKEEVSSKAVGRAVLKRLKKIDKVAWLRFASVYLEFADLEDFARAIKT